MDSVALLRMDLDPKATSHPRGGPSTMPARLGIETTGWTYLALYPVTGEGNRSQGRSSTDYHSSIQDRGNLELSQSRIPPSINMSPKDPLTVMSMVMVHRE